MKYMGLNEIREKYLSFFESKGHLRVDSFPLVPIGDNSLLLINSGMAPLKAYFTGEQIPPNIRMTTCQKCIRTPDIERVGKTSRHGTFFEMLGNFSFGDYFKIDATKWAWEFITQVMEIPIDKLWISIYLDDDEAFDIWTNIVGVSPERIVRLGKADNFWEIGKGPCGPCSEIYFDRGEKYACDNPDCAVGCDCDRYVEFWNLVFTQFFNDGNNNYTPLATKNIDTGMGLERLACIMQGVDSLFDVDTVKNITNHISEISGKKYGENVEIDISLRVITDHIRSTVMLVSDGVVPSNEGRGYVLRRLLRRAARHGKLLGVNKPFLYEVASTVIKESGEAYKHLNDKKDYIIKVIKIEEERFADTIDSGLKLLDEMIKKSTNEFSAEDAFKLYDTFGFPIDLTLEILSENNLSLNREKFDELMLEQKTRARSARACGHGWEDENLGLDKSIKTEFLGYELNESKSKVLAVISTDENISLVLDKTPFYAESGGQKSDFGTIKSDNATMLVTNVRKTVDGKFIHAGTMESGMFDKGDTVTASINADRRLSVKRAHTAAHLMHKALKIVLGEHAEQAGSEISDDTIRFDFMHFSSVTPDEIIKIENIVNDAILQGIPVITEQMNITDAKNKGAVALFGEKYGQEVRVVSAGDFSIELCGGTHIDNTSRIGLFKIISEVSVASGVRRIEAVTGKNIIKLINDNTNILNDTADILKSNIKDIKPKALQIIGELKQAKTNIDKLSSQIANLRSADLFNYSKQIKGIDVISAAFNDIDSDTLRNMADNLKEKNENIIAVLVAVIDGKINFICVCGKEAIKKGAHAGKIIKEVASITGGSGGGRPDSAKAGGNDISKIEEAIENVNNIVEKLI